jgi:hypothetical protein
MNMERKYIMRRRAAVFAAATLLLSLFTYATRDICYVGQTGNALGYGSCQKMIEDTVNGGK